MGQSSHPLPPHLNIARQNQNEREAMSPRELDTASTTLDMLVSVSDRLEASWVCEAGW